MNNKQQTVITEGLLTGVLNVLKHIKDVQLNVKDLSEQSTTCLFNFIQEHNVEISSEASSAMQSQDVIAQQLLAVVDAINGIEKSIDIHIRAIREDHAILSQSFSKLHHRLEAELELAKKKQLSFTGHAFIHHELRDDELEYF